MIRTITRVCYVSLCFCEHQRYHIDLEGASTYKKKSHPLIFMNWRDFCTKNRSRLTKSSPRNLNESMKTMYMAITTRREGDLVTELYMFVLYYVLSLKVHCKRLAAIIFHFAVHYFVFPGFRFISSQKHCWCPHDHCFATLSN